MSCLIGVTVYNSSRQIERVIRSLNSLEADLKKLEVKILIIDNCSEDNTGKVSLDTIKELNSGIIKYIKNKTNLGLGGNQKKIFQIAQKQKYNFVGIFHGDDQADVNDLVFCIEKAKTNAIILGARFMDGSTLIGYSKVRIIANKFFNFLFSLIFRTKVYDLGSGLNIYPVKALNKINYLELPNDLSFNYYLSMQIFKGTSPYLYVPIAWTETDQVSNAKLLPLGVTLLKILKTEALNRHHR